MIPCDSNSLNEASTYSFLTFEDPIKKVEMLAVPQDEFRVTVMVDYGSEVLGTQHAGMYNIGEFKKEIVHYCGLIYTSMRMGWYVENICPTKHHTRTEYCC